MSRCIELYILNVWFIVVNYTSIKLSKNKTKTKNICGNNTEFMIKVLSV